MAATIVHAARTLGIKDAPDGAERVSGHSLRTTGAQGLIRLGWRADAVRLMGRWDSEAVRRYTRDAALQAPTGLEALIMRLCGSSRLEVPPPLPSTPEPASSPADRWVMNAESDMYHLMSDVPGRARCGWHYERLWGHGGLPTPMALRHLF